MENNKQQTKFKFLNLKVAHILLIILGIIFISLSAFQRNIWFDEAYSVGMADRSFVEIWNIGGHDVHPILYYWMLKIIALLTGSSVIAYRIFSVIPVAILGILGYTHIRKDYGEKTGFIFSFLSYFITQMSAFAIEIRMYSWAMLTVTILAIYAYRLSKKQSFKNWLIFFIASLISIYIHYYGLMAAGLINLILLINLIKSKNKKGIVEIIVLGIIQAALYIPWLIYFVLQLGQVSNGFWIGFEFPFTILELVSTQFLGRLDVGFVFVLVVELYMFLYFEYKKLKKQNTEDLTPVKYAVGLYLGVILAAIVMTCCLTTSILYHRYLFVITGLLIFAISFILARVENKKILITIMTLIALGSCVNQCKTIIKNYDKSNEELYTYLEKNIKDEQIVFANIANGSVVSVTCKENEKYFYNYDNWGVEEAYKAFGKMETCIDDKFVEKLKDVFWIVDDEREDVYNRLFNTEDYKVIKKDIIKTASPEYTYVMLLVERVSK